MRGFHVAIYIIVKCRKQETGSREEEVRSKKKELRTKKDTPSPIVYPPPPLLIFEFYAYPENHDPFPIDFYLILDYDSLMLIITSPYFVAGYDLQTGNIAPIIKYMRGWSIEKIRSYCQRKGWSLEYLAPPV